MWTRPTASWTCWRAWPSRRQKRKIIGARVHPRVRGRGAQAGRHSLPGPGHHLPRHSGDRKDGVKAHHNVGGLPEDLEFELVEPAEAAVQGRGARRSARRWACRDSMVYRQPFPGPGLGVRCLGAITRDRLEALREADAILREEFDKQRSGGQGLAVLHRRARLHAPRACATASAPTSWPAIIRAVNTVDVNDRRR